MLSNTRPRKHYTTKYDYDFDYIEKLRSDNLSWDKVAEKESIRLKLAKPIAKSVIYRAYRTYQKNKPEIIFQKTLDSGQILSTDNRPETAGTYAKPFHLIEDTRSWAWDRWTKKFTRDILFDKQLETLDRMENENTIQNFARQHGKSSKILKNFFLRKLCESVFDFLDGEDRPLLYVSNSTANLTKFMTTIKHALMTNPAILNHYGFLVNRAKVEGLSLAPNTKFELRLTSLVDYYLLNLYCTTPESALRGGNFYYVIFDDGVEYKEKAQDPASQMKATENLWEYWQKKVMPLTKGFTHFIGTRYNKRDIYVRADETGMFFWIEYPAIIGDIPEYTIPERKKLANGRYSLQRPEQIIVHGPAQLLFPELWKTQTGPKASKMYTGTPIQNLLYREVITDAATFLQEYMLQPASLKSSFDLENLGSYDYLPRDYPDTFQWVIVVDPAITKKSHSNITSMALVGKPNDLNHFYIHDMIYGLWTSREKLEKLEDLFTKSIADLRINPWEIAVYIESRTSTDFKDRVSEESRIIRPHDLDPKERGDKNERIIHNFGHDLDEGNIFLRNNSRSKKRLQDEILAFPGMHPDLLDVIDHAIYLLREEIIDNPTWVGI